MMGKRDNVSVMPGSRELLVTAVQWGISITLSVKLASVHLMAPIMMCAIQPLGSVRVSQALQASSVTGASTSLTPSLIAKVKARSVIQPALWIRILAIASVCKM